MLHICILMYINAYIYSYTLQTIAVVNYDSLYRIIIKDSPFTVISQKQKVLFYLSSFVLSAK